MKRGKQCQRDVYDGASVMARQCLNRAKERNARGRWDCGRHDRPVTPKPTVAAQRGTP